LNIVIETLVGNWSIMSHDLRPTIKNHTLKRCGDIFVNKNIFFTFDPFRSNVNDFLKYCVQLFFPTSTSLKNLCVRLLSSLMKTLSVVEAWVT